MGKTEGILMWKSKVRLALLLAGSLASLACDASTTNGDGDPTAPGTPTIATPMAGAGISTPVIVEGTTVGDATVTVTILADTSELGTGSGIADAAGSYSVVVILADSAPGTDLTVRAVASNAAGTSSPAEVAVHQRVDAPTITTPTTGSYVTSPLRITGTGIAGATVAVAITSSTGTIGTDTLTLTGNTINVAVPYTEPSGDADITLSVTQTTLGHISTAVDVTVKQSSIPRPTVATPAADSQVTSPVVVTGTTTAASTPFTILVSDASGELGRSTGTSDGTGAVALDVAYFQPGAGTSLLLYAYQTVDGIDSPAVVRNLVQLVPAPNPTTPVAGTQITSAANVAGIGAPNATIDVVVSASSSQIGTGSGTATAGGMFDFDVTYTEPAPGVPIDMTFTQTAGTTSSTAVTVAVTQMVPAPIVTAPATDDEIDSPVQVTGTGLASASIDVTITDASGTLGTGTATTNGAGAFDFPVSYGLPASYAAMTVVVTQTVNGVASAPTSMTATQAVRYFTLSGSISQASGNNTGTVYVRVYDTIDEVIEYLDATIVTSTSGQPLAPTTFSLTVPSGTHYLRAFRDSTGPDGPDGFPTIGGDPQVPATLAVVGQATDIGLVTLIDVSTSGTLSNLEVYTSHESSQPEPVEYRVGEDRYYGTGLCGGYTLRMEAQGNGDLSQFTPPLVRHPDGSETRLYDDGGCSEAVHDNSNMSFDGFADDQRFSAGTFDPGTSAAGSYFLHYRTTNSNFIHVEEDLVSEIRKLTRAVPLTSHDGTTHLDILQPTFEWAAVPGANSYQIGVNWSGDGFGADTPGTSHVVSSDLPDNSAIRVSVDPAWFDGDLEARAYGVENYLVVDQDGSDIMTVSGTISNESGTVASYLVYGTGDRDGNPEWNASVTVPSDASAYSLEILEDTGCNDRGAVQVVMDVDGSGDPRSFANDSSRKEFSGCGADPGLAFAFRPPVVQLAPPDGASATGDTPSFSWENYATTWATSGTSASLPSDWSYLLWLGYGMSGGGGMPQIIWGLPDTATAFDLATPPAEKFDVLDFATTGATQNAEDLGADTSWMWNIVVVECPYGSSPAYETCIGAIFAGEPNFFAQGDERSLTTD